MKKIALVLLLVWSGSIAGPGDAWYVKSTSATIYSEPSADSETVMCVGIGRKLIEFTRRGDWINVGVDKSGGKDGWIRASDVGKTDPDGLTY